MAGQECIWLLFEQVRLGHLMVQAAGWIVEVFVREQVDADAVLGFIYLDNLGNVEEHEEEKAGVKMQYGDL